VVDLSLMPRGFGSSQKKKNGWSLNIRITATSFVSLPTYPNSVERVTEVSWKEDSCYSVFNPLTPNDPYSGRTAPLTSKRCILCIYSTNVGTEYFKHGKYAPFFYLFKMQFVS
jgi:hypothetical protein